MFFFKLLAKLPFPVLYAISDFIFLISYHVIGYRKKVVLDNLKKSFPGFSESELKATQKAFHRHLCDLIVESIKLLTISEKQILERVKIKNIELPLSQIQNNQTIIVACGHTGNWEWLLQVCSIASRCPIDAVYKPLSSRFFDNLMIKIRSRFGATPLPMNDVPRSLVKKKTMVRGIAMVADQTPPKSEIQFWNTFLNQETPWYVGTEKIAIMADLPVYFVGMNKIARGRYEIYFEEIAKPPYDKKDVSYSMIEKLSEKIEENIKNQPPYWLWSHRRWKHKKN